MYLIKIDKFLLTKFRDVTNYNLSLMTGTAEESE